MADKKLSNEPTLDNSTIDTADLIYVADVSASQTKGITNANLMSPKSSTFRVVDSSDLTKKVAFDVSGVTTATTRTLTIPDASTTIVGTDTTQTLTNKSIGAGTKINTSGSDTVGSLYYRDASGNLVPLAPGSAGTILDISSGGLPEFIPNPAASNASLTVKGVGQEATQALTDAGTEVGSTGAINIVTPLQLRARLLNTGVADTGAANAYVITPSPAITAYATYQEFTFVATNANTGPSTLAVSGLTTKAITKNGTDALIGGEIVAGQVTKVVYDGTRFQLAGPVSTGSSFIRLATLTINQSVSSGVLTKVGEFTGLTGNTDDEYLVEFELNNSLVPADNTHYLAVRLNDDSGSNYSTGLAGMKSGAVAYNQSGLAATSGTLARSDTSFPANLMFGNLKIKASTTIAGTARCIISNVSISNGSVGIIFNGNINWSDASNQITSVQLYVQQSGGSPDTVTGKASIYKISR